RSWCQPPCVVASPTNTGGSHDGGGVAQPVTPSSTLQVVQQVWCATGTVYGMSVFNPPRVPAPIVAATLLLVLVWAGLTLRSLGDLARHYIDGNPVTITDVGFAVIGSGLGFLLHCGAAFGLWQGNRVAQIAVLVLAGLTVVVGFLS